MYLAHKVKHCPNPVTTITKQRQAKIRHLLNIKSCRVIGPSPEWDPGPSIGPPYRRRCSVELILKNQILCKIRKAYSASIPL